VTAWPDWDDDEPQPPGPICEVDGDTIDTYGGEHYWHCGRAGEITVEGTLMCLDHAGERGYGPKQEEYGFDPDDGHDPDREAIRTTLTGDDSGRTENAP
jgi:hypothetical protein